MLLGGLRRRHEFAESVSGIPAQWHEFVSLIGTIPGRIPAKTYGAMCGSDSEGFEYMCAVEVESFAGLPPDLGRMRILEQQYAVFVHRGHASEIRTVWGRVFNEWLPNSGRQSAHKPDFEVYGPRFDPRTGTGEVEIWIALAEEYDAIAVCRIN